MANDGRAVIKEGEMKRFLSVGGSGPAPKVQKVSSLVPRGDPRTLIAWNVENLATPTGEAPLKRSQPALDCIYNRSCCSKQ